MIGAGDIDERYADERDARRFACDGCGGSYRADHDWLKREERGTDKFYCANCQDDLPPLSKCPECGDGPDVCQCAEVLP